MELNGRTPFSLTEVLLLVIILLMIYSMYKFGMFH